MHAVYNDAVFKFQHSKVKVHGNMLMYTIQSQSILPLYYLLQLY